MSAVFHWLASGVLAGTAFFVLAWLVSVTWLKRARPEVHSLLFGLVLLRFLVPFGPTFSFSPLSAPGAHTDGAWVAQGTPVIEQLEPAQSVASLIVAAWSLGVFGLTLARFARYRRVRRLVARLATGAPETVVTRVSAVCARMGVSMPRVLLGDLGPCVVGVIRPFLVLPADARADVIDAMVVHEVMHMRRRDPLLRFVQSVVETLFFFWPVVRIASRRLTLASEQACDLAVVEAGVMGPAPYAELLLEVGLKHEVGLAMAAKPSHLERRIDMLLTERKLRPMWGALALATIFGFAGTGGAIAANPTESPSPALVTGAVESVEGPFGKELIQTVVAVHMNELRACYQDLLAEQPDAEGTVNLHWAIDDRGSVKEICASEGTTLEGKLSRCVSDRISAWQFPRADFGEVINVKYPFMFGLARK